MMRYPKGPKIEKFQSRLKFSISLEKFNLAWNFQSWRSEFPTKNRGLVGPKDPTVLKILQRRRI